MVASFCASKSKHTGHSKMASIVRREVNNKLDRGMMVKENTDIGEVEGNMELWPSVVNSGQQREKKHYTVVCTVYSAVHSM